MATSMLARRQPTYLQTMAVLGGVRILGEIDTTLDLADRVQKGLPYEALSAFQSETGLPLHELADLLQIARRTLDRRRGEQLLKPDESDRLARVARVYSRAVSVLGDRDKARNWLDRPNRALGNRTPRSLLDTDAGSREIDQILGRIEHGLFS